MVLSRSTHSGDMTVPSGTCQSQLTMARAMTRVSAPGSLGSWSAGSSQQPASWALSTPCATLRLSAGDLCCAAQLQAAAACRAGMTACAHLKWEPARQHLVQDHPARPDVRGPVHIGRAQRLAGRWALSVQALAQAVALSRHLHWQLAWSFRLAQDRTGSGRDRPAAREARSPVRKARTCRPCCPHPWRP